jgi:hypothetical protein
MDALQFKDAIEQIGWEYEDVAERLHVSIKFIKRIARGAVPVPDEYAVWLRDLIDFIALAPEAPRESKIGLCVGNAGVLTCDGETVGYLFCIDQFSDLNRNCGYLFIGDPPGTTRIIGSWDEAGQAAIAEWDRRISGAPIS